ncbi:prolyl-tRNA synthetase associated domain-containing protein [Candidatus Gracilibacteria bacterium]|nr:MAG: prolyl-tRNA synthetase associated domain-containing protein [Candidatus Gracilibacteria bacterium]
MIYFSIKLIKKQKFKKIFTKYKFCLKFLKNKKILMQRIYNKLKELNIIFQDFSHNPTFTCDEARCIDIPGERVKSLILTNKNKTNFFMVILGDDKKLDVKNLQKLLGENKLSFAKEEYIIEKVGVKIGHISPFALINNETKDIKIIFDEVLKGKQIGFHPLRNDKTIVLNMDFMEKFLKNLNFEYFYFEL